MFADLKLAKAYDGLIFLAETERNPPYIRSHHHRELELNLVVRGSITYVLRGRRHSFPSGTMLWIFPYEEHQLVDRTPDSQYFVAVFKDGVVNRTLHDARFGDLRIATTADHESNNRCRRLRLSDFESLRQIMTMLMEGALDPDTLNREAGYGAGSTFRFAHNDPDMLNAGLAFLLLRAWKCFLAGVPSDSAVQMHPGVMKALGILSTQTDDLALSAVSAQCGVSSQYLSRMFREQVGVPLTKYRNTVRLNRFMELFTGPKRLTMLEAVYEAGFGSYAQFFKVFVQSFGTSPSRYFGARAKP